MAQVLPNILTHEKLTSQEADQMSIGPSISTITFVRGTDPTSALRSRLELVVRANPWLAGTLAKRNGGALHLSYPSLDDIDIDALFNPTKRGGKMKKVPVLSSTMGYFDVCKELSGTAPEILPGSASSNGKEPLLALSVIPDSIKPENTFAIIFSVSHVIVDGFTYYKLLSMLNSNGVIEELSAVRKHDVVIDIGKAVGQKEHAYLNSGGVICNVLCSMLCGSQAFIENYYIDDEKIKEGKSESAADNEVPWVSTNDVITSAFGNATSARTLLMPLNFRRRLPAYKDKDAGNYEGAMVFGPEDYALPARIRKTLNSGPPLYIRETTIDMPGCCESMRCQMSMVTNWCFPFFSEVDIEGCKQMLHMPHVDVTMIPFDVAVITQAHAGKQALTCFSRTMRRTSDVQDSLPVGDVIQNAEQAFESTSEF